MQEQLPKINKKSMQANKDSFEKLMNTRSFYFLGSEIYGGVGGLYDWGPPGCAIRTNVQQLWREHFILEEDMLEISTTCMTPEVVFKHSGHIKKFADLVVRDSVNRRPERADKYLDTWITNLLENEQTPALTEQQIHRLKEIQQSAEGYSSQEMFQAYQELKIKSIDGNDFTEPEPFNLMFKAEIGPGGGQVGYLRPETAQGMFVNFNRLQNFASGKVPFAAAQLGLGFRNEIAPRNQLLRVREFDMAEIEHFFDPQHPSHPKFKYYQNEELPLLSAKRQIDELSEDPIFSKVGEAVQSGLISNETMAYFLVRTYLFLVQAGVNKNNIRFRQHKPKEMAHYAVDCWDAEIETSNGWIEAVGHANRSAYDLNCHQKGSGQAMYASRRLPEPKKVEYVEIALDQGKMGKDFQRKIQLNVYYQGLNEEERAQLEKELQDVKEKEVSVVSYTEKKDKEGNVIEKKEKVAKFNIDLPTLKEIQAQGQHFATMQPTLKAHIENQSDEENRALLKHLETNPSYTFNLPDFTVEFPKEYIKKVKECSKNVSEEKFVPAVIEPAFGLGRIISAILEHNYQIREEKQAQPEEQQQQPEEGKKKKKKEAKSEQVKPVRSYLTLPPRIAPIKCSLLPLMAKEVFSETIFNLKKELTRAGISNKVDDSGVSVGKRYARTDELGIPFGITVDYETLEEGERKNTVTLREIQTTKQIRIPIKDVVSTIQRLCDGQTLWSDVLQQYPLQEQAEEN